MLKQLNSQKHNRNKKAQLAVAREDALRLYMQVLLQYWPSRSSKVNDFYFTRKGVRMPLSISD